MRPYVKLLRPLVIISKITLALQLKALRGTAQDKPNSDMSA